jgi:glycosyltransferase involved in cell wall biosynthesis
MVEPFDIWMCTYNSAKLLPIILPRITQVIPPEAINRKFIVDDFSSDKTKEAAKKLGWEVYANKKKGLYNARHYAFSLVETNYCASFEHDLYLSEKWYPRIPNFVVDGDYDIAQGVRIRDARGFKELDIYDNNHRIITSEDNTFYAMIPDWNRQILEGKVENGISSLKYRVDRSICSRHMRGNTMTSLRHGYYVYRRVNNEKISAHAECLAKSLLLSLKVFKETKGYSVIALYPLERLMILTGAITSKIV